MEKVLKNQKKSLQQNDFSVANTSKCEFLGNHASKLINWRVVDSKFGSKTKAARLKCYIIRKSNK